MSWLGRSLERGKDKQQVQLNAMNSDKRLLRAGVPGSTLHSASMEMID